MNLKFFSFLGLVAFVFVTIGCDSNNSSDNMKPGKVRTEWDYGKDETIDSITYHTYDSKGNLTMEETDSDNDGMIDSVTSFIYEGNLLKRKEIDYESEYYEIWDHTYDNDILISSTLEESYIYIRPEGTVTDSVLINYTYFCDESGNVITKNVIRDDGTIGLVFTYEYDDYGNMVKEKTDYENDGIIDLIVTLSYSYDANGNTIEASVDNNSDGIFDDIVYYIWE